MRISTANAYDASIEGLQQRQQQLSDSQLQLTSGKRVNKASDDPAAAARAERALTTITRTDATKRALQASQNAMALTESALADAGGLLQDARETMVAAGNATYSDSDRESLAERLSRIRSQLFDVANRSDGAGSYLFAGQGSSQPPFVDMPGGVQFVGTQGATRVPDDGMPMSADGAAIWLQASTGNGVFNTAVGVPNSGGAWIDSGSVTSPAALTASSYTVTISSAGGAPTYTVLKDGLATALTNVPFVSGQAITIDGMSFSINGAPANGDTFTATPSTRTLNVFTALDRTIADLKTPGRTSAQNAQTVQRALRDLDQSMTTVNAARAEAGETLNQGDAAQGRNDDLKLAAQSQRSNAEDLDMMAAVSEFQNRQSGYDAALKTYSMVQRLSLFEYIR
ncbi:MAG TPA: flagellar hook-associated protein FlgL [Burkholderiaceae bacterium]|nr:flagellar hook-associated protein FlgL [Burkholderiaceae bacterium]